MIKHFITPTRFLLAAACLTLCSCSAPNPGRPIDAANYTLPIRVACVGDSITYGAGIQDREHNSYPAQLGRMLGEDWKVRNFGVSGSTLLKNGDRPYWDQQAYRDALAFEPDVVIIKLGSNDSKPPNWAYENEFVQDYVALIQSFQELDSSPRIWICRPVPAFPERWGISDAVIAGEVIPYVDEAAAITGVPVIDLHAALEGKSGMFPDKIHPNAAGAEVISETVSAALTGRVHAVQ